jgi:hypothetical protein
MAPSSRHDLPSGLVTELDFLRLRACSTISASFCCVEQALSHCFDRQLWRRADALIRRRCLRQRCTAGRLQATHPTGRYRTNRRTAPFYAAGYSPTLPAPTVARSRSARFAKLRVIFLPYCNVGTVTLRVIPNGQCHAARHATNPFCPRTEPIRRQRLI